MAKAKKKAPVKAKAKPAAKKKAAPKKVAKIPVMEPKVVVPKEEKIDVEALRKEQALKVSQEKAEVRKKANKQRITRPH